MDHTEHRLAPAVKREEELDKQSIMLKALLASLAGAAALLALTMSNPVAGFAPPSSPFHPPSSSRSPAATALRMTARGDGGPGAADEGSTRRAAALQQLGAVGVAAWLGVGVGVVGGLPGPAQAAAKKITNLEEARALGEKKMAEIEKAKGPLIKVRDGALVWIWGLEGIWTMGFGVSWAWSTH